MSYAQFPSIVPGKWSIAFPIKKTPVYSTIVQTPASGRAELRIPLYPYPHWNFDIEVPYLVGDFQTLNSWLQLVVGFYMSQQGSAGQWLYEDMFDNYVNNMNFGTGDGTTTQFQLTRQLNSGLDIMQNLNGTPIITVNGTAPSTQPTVSSLGIVTFATAPASGAALAWSGQFYYLCRFVDDKLDLQQDMNLLWSMSKLRFMSVIQ